MNDVGDAFELPMFPLGTVCFPHGVLPLQVFEPRYRALVARCLASDGRFGVVLIERGSEVGGGDTRFSVGTIAQIAQARELPDGRWALVSVGVERLAVREWLPDDPYPRAQVVVWPDRAPPREAAAAAVTEAVDAVRTALVRVHALRAELGLPAHTGPVMTSAEDLTRASWEAAILAPLGPLDALALLGVDDPLARLELCVELLGDEIEALSFRLSAS